MGTWMLFMRGICEWHANYATNWLLLFGEIQFWLVVGKKQHKRIMWSVWLSLGVFYAPSNWVMELPAGSGYGLKIQDIVQG